MKSLIYLFLLFLVLFGVFVGWKTQAIHDEKKMASVELNSVIQDYEKKNLRGDWEVKQRILEILESYDTTVKEDDIDLEFVDNGKSVEFSVPFRKNADFIVKQWPFEFLLNIPYEAEEGIAALRGAKRSVGNARDVKEEKMKTLDTVLD